MNCHRYFTDHPAEFEVFVIKMIGQKKYDDLIQRSLQTGKIDLGAINYRLQKALKNGWNGMWKYPLDSDL